MKQILSLLLACFTGLSTSVMAQNTPEENKNAPVLNSSSTGDLYQGMTKSIPSGRVVAPYGLEVTYEKTVHLLFPSAIRYVDLGSPNLIAAKAEDADNVLRVKAAVKDFETETNLAVICEDGSYYTYNVKYADEPRKLSIEMQDFLHVNNGYHPSNRSSVYFKELGSESPILVKLIMSTIYHNNETQFSHIGCKRFGLRFLLKGIYVHNGLLYFHTYLQNKTNIAYPVDMVTFKVVDKKVAKRTAIQERVLQPVRTQNDPSLVPGHHSERGIYALEQFTLPEDKLLEVTVYERNGARMLSFTLNNKELLKARLIDNLKLKYK